MKPSVRHAGLCGWPCLLLVTCLIAACDRPDAQPGAPAQTSQPVFRAAGTEPFWGLSIAAEGLRFSTPDRPEGRYFPPVQPTIENDTLRWLSVSDTGRIEVHIAAGHCSDMMSDRLWTHRATVRVDEHVFAGCADRPVEPSRARDVLGDWVVVFHSTPGLSAMDYDQAIGWNGRTLHFTPQLAVSGEQRCVQPEYRHHTVAVADFLLDQFRIAPAALGLDDTVDFGVTEVDCAGQRWSVPGGLLLWADDRPPWMVWDGVFFELRRAP